MSNTLLLKRSSTPNTAPAVGNLALGELAINTYDGRLYTKIDTGTPSVFELTQNQPITVSGNVVGTSVNGTGNTNISLTLTTTGVTAGTYGGTSGASSNVGVFTVDQYGRVTSASNVTISTSSLANGTANIQIFNNGNVAISPAGTSNVAVFAATGEFVSGILSVTGNITGGNIGTAGKVTATGDITGGNIVTAPGGNFILGNTTSYLTQTGGNTRIGLDGNVILTPDVVADPTAGVIIGGNGYLLAPNGSRNAALNYGGASGTLGIYSVNVYGNTTTAITNGGANGVGNIGANATNRFNTFFGLGIDVTNSVNAGSLLTSGIASATGNITGGNINTGGNVAAGGVLTDNYYYANGSPVDFQQAAGANTQLQFNSNNDFGASANLTFNSTTNILTVTGVSSTTGNVIGGNINTAGLASVGGNVIGGNINTAGNVSATGNIAGGNITITGNVATGGIKTDNYYYANGAPVDFQQPAGSNTQIQFNNNNDFGASANFTFNTASNVLVVNATANIGNTNVTGYVTATSNVTGGNISTAGLVTAGGNVTGANLITTGLATVVGNVIGGNISTAGLVTATGNVTAGNVNTVGLITATGNVTGGNFNTAGLVTATGNVTGGNINTSGAVVTPAITSASAGLTISTAGGNLNLTPTTGNIVVNTYINNLSTPQQATDAATKAYVDNAVSAGITIHQPVLVITPSALTATYADGGTTQTVTTITGSKTLTFSSSPALTVNDVIVFSSTANGLTAGTAYFVYSTNGSNQVTLSTAYDGVEITTLTNGTGLSISSRANSGVGATLTNSGVNAALSIDGVALSLNNRVLVNNQASAFQNGVYTVTTVGNGSTPWVLTRAANEDRYGPKATDELDVGDYFFVQSGNTGAGDSYVLTSPTGTIIFGTTNIAFTQFSEAGVYSANTSAGLSLTGTVFSAKVDDITTAFDGSGNIVVKASAQLTTPNIGAATGTSLNVTANVTGGNITTAGLITATGNITGGNINTAGAISTTANVVGGNINTSGLVSVTGNVIGGNLTTAGLANVATLSVTNWANIIGNTVSTSTTTGALKVAGGVGVVGNIYAGSLYSAGEAVLTVNSTIDGGTY